MKEAEAAFKQAAALPEGQLDGLAVLCMLRQRNKSWHTAQVRAPAVCRLERQGQASHDDLMACA